MTDSLNTIRVRRIRDIALTVGAVVGTLCIVAALLSVIFNLTTLVFRSGSMEPTIASGSVAVARTVPATELQVGDVVSVINDQGSRVTHRVHSVDGAAGNTALLTLKGDANSEPDPRPYGVASADRVLFHVTGLGYIVMWFVSPAGLLVLGVGAAALVWIAIWPEGRPRTSSGRHSTGAYPVPTIVCLTTITAVGLGHVPGTHAAFTDTAVARSGAFSTKPEFVPKVPGTVGCSGRLIVGEPDPVTLSWQHVGAPYQYRIILRDLDGQVWRTWDVTNVTAAAGATISYDIWGVGLPRRGVIWRYHAEVHTMLPGGPVSAAWTGRLVSQPAGVLGQEDLNCSPSGERDGTPAYVAPPASIACVTSGSGSSAAARLTWPHVGAGFTYLLTVRDTSSSNPALTTTVTSVPANTGASVTRNLATGDLNMGEMKGSVGRVEVRSIQGGSISTGFAAYDLNISSAGGVTCSTPAPNARSAPLRAPATIPVPTPTTSPTSGADATGSRPETSVVVPPPTEASGTPSAEPDTGSERALRPAIPSTTGNYTAQLVESASGPSAVIRTSGGNEVYRTSASASDTMRWIAGTDELRIEGPSGVWSVSNATGVWTKTAVVEPLPPPEPAPAAPEPSPAVPNPVPVPDPQPNAPADEEAPEGEVVVPQTVEEATPSTDPEV
ncbi:signal peptidase I [Rhodococcus rhodochrous]|uniref:signal peptidase I n=1 Tax=Rhodococcus rhodochrous TaxID=1829 RepID=UPI00167B8A01|nr:signal peptidase I [Rhodococcus rhodochrous]